VAMAAAKEGRQLFTAEIPKKLIVEMERVIADRKVA